MIKGRPEMRRRRPADIERAVEMHVYDRVPFLGRHLMKDPVAQDPGIVDHAIDASEGIERAGDNVRCAVPVRHAVAVDGGLAAGILDFAGDFPGRGDIRPLAIDAGAEIVDHHQGAFAG